MARRRKYGEDLTYAEWHRNVLPKMYGRVGHRQDMADRDWTEFCHHCKEPLAVVEEVIDFGQDISDKATTVTRKMAAKAGVTGYLVAPRIVRPRYVQDEIDELNRRVRELESEYPIVSFKAKQLWPQRGELREYTPDEWAEHLLVIHRDHHMRCFTARHRREIPVNVVGLQKAKDRSVGLWSAANDQDMLDLDESR